MPSTPALVMMPLSTAEADAGATGWAVGSQPWSGNIPALVPKPSAMISAMATTVFSWPATFSASRIPPGAKLQEDIYGASWKIPSSTRDAPMTEKIRYLMPAATESGVISCMTSGTVRSVISS